MYRKKPTCSMLYKTNHLLGTCPVCGPGKYTPNRKTNILQVPLDRIYTVLHKNSATVPTLLAVIKRFPNVRTNLEYPLPIIRYFSSVHIPQFIDVETKTVIDTVPTLNRTNRALMQRTSESLDLVGYNYLCMSAGEDVLSRINHTTLSTQQKHAKFVQHIQKFMKVHSL